jgi:1-acyl-sn-glycerol-3-phosphate acyltransferase
MWPLLRALLRIAAFLSLNLLLVPLYLIARPCSAALGHALVRSYCRASCAILGVDVTANGEPFRACPTLYVANHVSYLDVLILGALLDTAFIAKLEVAGWPLFGQLGRVTGTLFVRRHWRDAPVQCRALAARLEAGQSLVLFGEGTSTDGLAVRRFKTSLLSVVEAGRLERPVAVQAVTLAYCSLRDRTPIDRSNCDLYAWHGDAEFLPHLWGVVCGDGLRVRMTIEAPILSWGIQSRKAVGAQLQAIVAARLAQQLEAEPAIRTAPSAQPEAQPAWS